MPPEAIKNKDSGKLRDLWSLGCTIYQILTGTISATAVGSWACCFKLPFVPLNCDNVYATGSQEALPSAGRLITSSYCA